MTEKEKDKLAILNGFVKERRTDKIRKGVKKKYRLEDEVALFRKMNMATYDYLIYGKPFPEELIAEYKQYYGDVEAVKEEVDK